MKLLANVCLGGLPGSERVLFAVISGSLLLSDSLPDDDNDDGVVVIVGGDDESDCDRM